MLHNFIFENFVDKDGNPDGGVAKGTGFDIEWQRGPLGTGKDRKEPNGAFVETILMVAFTRLRFYQYGTDHPEIPHPSEPTKPGKFACPENEEAMFHIHSAIEALKRRTQARVAKGIEGTHQN